MAAVQIEMDFGAARRSIPPTHVPVAAQPPIRPAHMAGDRPAAHGAIETRAPADGVAAARLDRQRLEALLQARLGEAVSLVITDNERTMISTRRQPGLRQVRLHHMFLSADPATLHALGGYLDRSDPGAGAQLGSFIERHRERIRRRGVRRIRVRASGSHHDLQMLFDHINARYFDGRVDARITWARQTSAATGRRRSIKLGSYSSRHALIRIHPALDADWVPGFFVQYIIYHEMLHQVIPPRLVGGRRSLHGREFSRAERAFADYETAIAWEKQNLRRLLRA